MVFTGILLGAGPASACNVPVFRYALERWKPDAYEVHVFHKGQLSERDRAAVRLLERQAAGAANVGVEVVDLDKNPDESLRELYAEQRGATPPWVVVRTSDLNAEAVTVWSGKLDAAAVAALLDSPVRREVVRRILSGETAVWLLLESGDRAKDDAAEELLRTELARLARKLKLPKLTDDPVDRISPKGPPLRVAFSVIRLKRDDPAERLLVKTLLTSEDDLAAKTEPMAFAVFGRGRTLAARVGRGLNAKEIRSACVRLLAPCTCDVQKDLACFDLLLSADWASTGAVPPPAPVLPAQKPPPPASPEPLTVEEDQSLVPRRVLWGAIGGMALLVVVTGVWALRSGRG